jgi:hypothetical protein
MHCNELLELAAVVASRSATFLQSFDALPTSGLDRYWTASKCRFDRWASEMKRYQTTTLAQPSECLGESWSDLRPTIEEILTSEVLTRVWAALLCEHDTIRGANEAAPVARSVFVGHLEARHRALNIFLHGRGVPQDELISLNRLRRQCERWTEILLGFVSAYAGSASEFAFDRKAFEQAHRSIDNPAIQEGLTASLRASFHGRAFADSGNFELNEQIASGVLCCLNANLFLGTGVATSPWLRRLYETTDEATDWIQSLLDGELDGEDLESTRRFEI